MIPCFTCGGHNNYYWSYLLKLLMTSEDLKKLNAFRFRDSSSSEYGEYDLDLQTKSVIFLALQEKLLSPFTIICSVMSFWGLVNKWGSYFLKIDKFEPSSVPSTVNEFRDVIEFLVKPWLFYSEKRHRCFPLRVRASCALLCACRVRSSTWEAGGELTVAAVPQGLRQCTSILTEHCYWQNASPFHSLYS